MAERQTVCVLWQLFEDSEPMIQAVIRTKAGAEKRRAQIIAEADPPIYEESDFVIDEFRLED